MVTYILLFALSLGALVFASDRFVESAENIGLSFGISPFIIGVTIVAFGTSLPELAASIAAIYSGASEVVIGSVLGSNITNILLIIGVSSVIGRGIFLEHDIMNKDMPMLIMSVFLLFFIIMDGNVDVFEAICLLLFMGFFLWSSFTEDDDDSTEERPSVHFKDYLWLIFGAVVVYFGAVNTIKYLELISQAIGISAEVIALTVVALGTSLPELVVSIAAARKGKHALAVGNVLGSNIFNTCGVVGLPALLGDLTIPEHTISFSIIFNIVVTLFFAFSTLSKRINRIEGFLYLLFYVFYIVSNF